MIGGIISKEPIKDFYGHIKGYLETDKDGNARARDFYGKILGTYEVKENRTRDFYGKILANGDILASLIMTHGS